MIATGPNVYAHMYLQAVGKLLPDSLAFEQSKRRIRDGMNGKIIISSTGLLNVA